MSLIAELKRRNVVRVGVAYLVVGWVLTQVAGTLEAALTLPDWFDTVVVAFLALGFPLALFLSWAYEMTPEGVKKTEEVDASTSITHNTGRKLNYVIMAGLVAALGYIAFDKYMTVGEVEIVEVAAIDKSIAVLPFADLSPNGDQEYFSDGLTEEILNSLARLPELKVTARTSSFSFKGQNIPIPEIAAILGVAHIVEGSVRRAGDQLRITAQLIRAEDGFHLWSETYDRSVEDIFAVQEDVAENIARAMNIILDDESRAKMFTLGTRNVEAYEAFLKGDAISEDIHEGGSTETLWDAFELFTRAIEADPNFSNAYYYRVDVYVHLLLQGLSGHYLLDQHPEGMTTEKAYELLHQDLDKAITLSLSPGDRAVYEFEKITFSNDWRGMPAAIEKLEANINNLAEGFWGGWVLDTLPILQKADLTTQIIMAGLERNPLDPSLWAQLSVALFAMNRLEDSMAALEEAHRKGVIHVWFTELEISLSIALGELDNLQAIYDRLGPESEHLRAPVLVVLGRDEEASALLAVQAEANLPYTSRIWAYVLLGEQDKANTLARDFDSRLLGG